MIKTIFINGNSLYKGKQRTELPVLEDDISEIAIIFDTEDELKLFVSQFPKNMKIKVAFITSYKHDGNCTKEPYTQCRRMLPNAVTGSKNEIGDKRMIRFYNALKYWIFYPKPLIVNSSSFKK